MDLTLDEHKLLAEFRRLSPTGKQELIDFALYLNKKGESAQPGEGPAKNQCSLAKQKEPRPESAPEPIITE